MCGARGRRRPIPTASGRERVAGVTWQHRVGSREPFEEVVERRGTNLLHGARQPHAVRTQAIPRDLVDEHRIQVVHGGVPITVERVGRDGGQRRGDLREGRLHALVERRAPERVPPATPVVEVRVNEALGDGALRQLDESEDRPCASARRPARPAARRPGEPAAGRRGGGPESSSPASASFAIVDFPSPRSPADSAPPASRTKRIAVASCCQTISSVGSMVVPSSDINLSK